MPRPDIQLPPLYYHDHFHEMIGFVTQVYAPLLGPEELGFIEDFRRLDQWAQCLYIRMNNRKKAVFSPRDLRYEEIGDLTGGLDQLREHGFIRAVAETDYRSLLDDFDKPTLMGLARDYNVAEVKTNWPKARLSAWLHAHLGWRDFEQAFDLSERLLPLRKTEVGFLLYLYFGKLNDNLTSFALRDLGIVSVRSSKHYQARFSDMNEARAGYFYTQALRVLKSGGPAPDVADWPAADTDYTRTLRDKLAFATGQALEKARDPAGAIAVYERSSAFDAHERIVRLLYGAGQAERAKAMLDTMVDSPEHEEEYIFASDFLARKFGQQRTGIFTELLRGAESLTVDELYRGHPEYAAIRNFETQGWTAHHTENGLWPLLFGLVFWEELFESDTLSSGFDHLPHTLKDKSFHTRFASEIERKLVAIRAGGALGMVQAAIARHEGAGNGIVYWWPGLEALMTQLITTAPADGLAALLEAMGCDFYALRDGFPDLMLTRAGQLRFLEIKGEGDTLRRNQLARLNLLRKAGFEADICRVAYRVDPDQTYVVVDVETTGGRPPNDRVTEIGAVKIRNGEVIGEWSSLINPQKRIPVFITQLTGISNAMVADSPVFADVVDELAAFMEGAIFVAHNVNFDHGFIASEFRRLERPFRFAKLCTVASMRKYYPGLPSYGLANLCREFNIELTGHHRALADARAAAQLLGLVNEKRLGVAAAA